jgi:hypothetical protein
MVSSRINPNVTFKEHKTIDPEDSGYQSPLYDLTAWGKSVVITLGKPKFTFSNQNIVYYPIYLVSLKNAIEGCLGVFETNLASSNATPMHLDEDGDVDINKMGEPLFFVFAEKIVGKTHTTVETYLEHAAGITSTLVGNTEADTLPPPLNVVEILDEDSDEDDILKLHIKPGHSKLPPTDKESSKLFITNTKVRPPPLLSEEMEEEANEIKAKFKPSSRNNWIQNFLKNPYYDIHTINGDGNCFFSVVIEAFAQIGRETTIEKLRKILADEVTDEIYQQYRAVYTALDGQIRNYTKDMEQIKRTLEVELKARSQKTKSKPEADILVNEAKALKKKYDDLAAEKKHTRDLLYSTTGNLSNITTFELFKEYIQTPDYWADAWAISTIETKLNIKMIIFNEESFNQNDLNSVLNCGESNKDIQTKGAFNPEYYIITTYSGNHYQLVSYHDKKILKYSEIPYHIKILVIKKCLERNSGIYYLIEEFRNLKTKLGIDPDEGNPTVEKEEDEQLLMNGYNDLYDSNIVFMFYSKSNKKPFPGRGSHEEIPKDKVGEFSTLATIDEWRKKLDDAWTGAKFTLDGKEYASVEHYYQSAKFKNSHPDFAELFSLNSDSPISKDVDLCQGAGGKNGKYKKEQIRPKDYKIDPDFYPQRNKEERKRAVEAKFTQNMDMKELLLNTKNAKLVQYVSGSTRTPDITLMEIRKQL